MLVAAVVILVGVVVVASGRGGEIAPEYPDYPPIDLGPVTAADVALLRPPSAAWGYNMRVTDEALETIARAVTERDIKIAELQQQVDDLRGEPPQQGERRSSGAWPAVADAGYEEAKEAEGAEGTEQTGPAGSGWPFADRGARSADPETTRPEAFTARPGGGSPDGTGDPDTTCGTGQPAAWGRPASAAVWSGASQEDLPHNTGEPTNPDLPQQSPVWATAGQQHEAGPQQAGYGEGWVSAPGPAPAESSSGPAEGNGAGPPWAKVSSPWDEPDDAGAEPFVWDDSHQTLVWGAEHQRAKASRLQEQDEASEAGQDEPGPARTWRSRASGPGSGQDAAEPGQDGPGTGRDAAEPGQARRGPGPGRSGAGPTGRRPARPQRSRAGRRDRSGRGGAGPGRTGDRSGYSGAGPGRTGDRPGYGGAGPGRTGDRSGRGGAGPGRT